MEYKNDTLLDEKTLEQLEYHYRSILALLGEDPDREGLKKTPRRAAKAMCYLTHGYRKNDDDVIKSAIFEYGGSQIIIVRDIEFYSMCEHHILPFFGKVHLGYVPNGNMVGLSKIARLVEVFARRLQVQERLTKEICDSLFKTLSTHGVIVMIEGQHLCMQMRGVEKQGAVTTTLEYTGCFEEESRRAEFLRLLGR